MNLMPAWIIAMTAAIAGAALGAGVQQLRVTSAHADMAELRAEHANALLAIETASASFSAAMQVTEQDWAAKVEKESQDGQNRLATALHDADAARTAADGLRADLSGYRRAAANAATHPGATAVGSPAGDAIDVLADLFSRADERAGELAKAADVAHAAGLTCERAYDALVQRYAP